MPYNCYIGSKLTEAQKMKTKLNKTEMVKEIQKIESGKGEWEYVAFKIMGKRTFKILGYGNGDNWYMGDKVHTAFRNENSKKRSLAAIKQHLTCMVNFDLEGIGYSIKNGKVELIPAIK